MGTQKYRDKSGTVVNAKQFNGLDDYLTIVTWMKAYGDTYARAGEVTYATPEMSLQTTEGRMSARPGDWIVLTGLRFTVCRANDFATTYEPVDADS